MAIHHHLKAIAVFRALRGLAVGAAGVAISGQTEQGLMAKADQVVANLDMPLPVLEWLSRALGASSQPWVSQLVVLAMAWALLLFVQAYGLWRNRHWAVWLAFLTSVLVLGGFSWVALPVLGWRTTLVLAANLLVGLYLLFVLRRKHRVAQ